MLALCIVTMSIVSHTSIAVSRIELPSQHMTGFTIGTDTVNARERTLLQMIHDEFVTWYTGSTKQSLTMNALSALACQDIAVNIRRWVSIYEHINHSVIIDVFNGHWITVQSSDRVTKYVVTDAPSHLNTACTYDLTAPLQ